MCREKARLASSTHRLSSMLIEDETAMLAHHYRLALVDSIMYIHVYYSAKRRGVNLVCSCLVMMFLQVHPLLHLEWLVRTF